MPFDPDLVDPSVTAAEIEQAHDGDPAPFPNIEDADTLDDASPALRGLVGVVPATPAQALVNAKRLRDDHTFVGVGMCLATVRGPIFGLPPLWPDADTAMEHSAPFHPLTDTLAAPRGSVGFAANGGHGHVWLNLGGGLASTTDFHENGFEGVALISRMLAWCGATRWGWGEVLNGFDVWPGQRKPPRPHQPDDPKPHAPWTLEQRAAFIARRARIARREGHLARARQLKRWHDRMELRIKAHGG